MVPLQMLPKDALPLLDDPSWVWVDVREEDEFDYGHIPGIKHFPMSSLTPDSFAPFSKEQKIMVVCRTGSRSGRVVHALREMGYMHACNFSGGMVGYNMVAPSHIPVLMH